MYKTILVATDIEDGRRILKELEERGLQTTAAFWFHEDEDEWKLVVVPPEVEEKGRTALYEMLAAMLKDLVSPHSLIYKRAKQYAGPVGGPVREGPALDSYIYKMR